MDRKDRYFYLGGIAAIGFYVILISFLIFFLNDYNNSKRYVPKKSNNIAISVVMPSSAKKHVQNKNIRTSQKKIKQKKPAVRKITSSSRKEPYRAAKPIASLFKGIKIKTPRTKSSAKRLANAPKIHYKPSVKKSLKNHESAQRIINDINLSSASINIASKSSGVGEVNPYMTKLYKMLYSSWQPNVIFAGAHAKVRFDISVDGHFVYKILYPSNNQAFNESLVEYIDKLKQKGFPPNSLGHRLVVDVDFKAKE